SLPAPDQRQARALPPHSGRQLSLCPVLLVHRAAQRSPARVVALLQSPPTPLRHRRPVTSHQTYQPPWTSQLARSCLCRLSPWNETSRLLIDAHAPEALGRPSPLRSTLVSSSSGPRTRSLFAQEDHATLLRGLQRCLDGSDGVEPLAHRDDVRSVAVDRVAERLMFCGQGFLALQRVADDVALAPAPEGSHRFPDVRLVLSVRVEREIGIERIAHQGSLLAGHYRDPLLEGRQPVHEVAGDRPVRKSARDRDHVLVVSS